MYIIIIWTIEVIKFIVFPSCAKLQTGTLSHYERIGVRLGICNMVCGQTYITPEGTVALIISFYPLSVLFVHSFEHINKTTEIRLFKKLKPALVVSCKGAGLLCSWSPHRVSHVA